MAHGGYGKRRVAGRPSVPYRAGSVVGGIGRGRVRGPAVRKDPEKKAKIVSIKNQIRSIERLLKKALSVEMKDAQQKKLEELKKQADLHARCELERKMALRYRKIKFFERRKIERRIRRLEKQHRASSDGDNKAAEISQELAQLKEDLEYVRFFPKTEKYVSLFTGDDDQVVARRNELREKIKANRIAAAAAGVDLEETGSEDDGAVDMSEDDFFLAGSSSDEADADDEWTDRSPRVGEEKDDTSREVLPNSSGRDDVLNRTVPLNKRPRSFEVDRKTLRRAKDQRQRPASIVMPPPKTKGSQFSSSTSGGGGSKSGNWPSSGTSGDTGKRRNQRSSADSGAMIGNGKQRSSSSNSWEVVEGMKGKSVNAGSSASDVQQKPKRKRSRPKKKRKQQDIGLGP